jgi:hypothetical protein
MLKRAGLMCSHARDKEIAKIGESSIICIPRLLVTEYDDPGQERVSVQGVNRRVGSECSALRTTCRTGTFLNEPLMDATLVVEVGARERGDLVPIVKVVQTDVTDELKMLLDCIARGKGSEIFF